MPEYSYRVVDVKGDVQNGTIEADSLPSAVSQLRSRGYYIVKIDPRRERKKISFEKKVNARDLALFCRQLNTMLSAGIPLLMSLETIREQVKNKKLQKAIQSIIADLEEGDSLSGCMKKHRSVFPELTISMVEAGEVGGMLDEVLIRLAEHLDREYEVTEKVKSALTYPAVVLVIALAVVVTMVAFIIPNFTVMFKGMGLVLPLPTRLLIGTSSLVISYWYLLMVLFALSGILFYRYFKSERGKLQFDSMVIRIPIFGDLIKKLIIARFCRTLGTLLRGGVPILTALEVAGNTTGNRIVTGAITDAQERIREGSTMTEPFARTGIFPSMVIQMISVGEETGSLSELLLKASDFYEEEVETKVQKLSSLIEPVFIIFLGLIVGFIVFSIILPLFRMLGSI